ncbi:Hypothetical protein SCF082_LOCUS789 [Durusdinium trenchii]|uniref:Saccharopine dehydrogenase NADP binding domain-containing protein n=1 Tax=Durusdinium trenchii TaxID=1381693 RepID=A0ABP0H9V6_9DINO
MELRTAPTACAPRVLAPGVRGGAPRGARQRQQGLREQVSDPRPSRLPLDRQSTATGVRAARLHLPAAVMALGAAWLGTTVTQRRLKDRPESSRVFQPRRAQTTAWLARAARSDVPDFGGRAAHSAAPAADAVGRRIPVILAGRDRERGRAAVEEVKAEVDLKGLEHEISFRQVDWQEPGSHFDGIDGLLHTAGPFDGEPTVLRAALQERIPVYVDVADPMSYLDAAEAMEQKAKETETMALCSAGAFPGFSNVLAMECAQRLRDAGSTELEDLNFSYFTAGLGGSGPVNLLITNLGFGDPVPVWRQGRYAPRMAAGSEMREVDFFLDESDPAFDAVGTREVWSWPFPEAGTVPRRLKIRGNSSTGMGTAPGIWNTILVALVSLVPRSLWRNRSFSEGLAYFSLPMVWVTDQFFGGADIGCAV